MKNKERFNPTTQLAEIPRVFPGGENVLFPAEAISQGIGAAKAVVGVFKVIAYWVARAIIGPCEVVFRYNIGERYFNGLAYIVFITCAVLFHALGDANAEVLRGIAIVFSGGVSLHYWRCFARDRRGEYWHSYAEGESHIRIDRIDAFLAERRFTLDFSKLVIEPAILLAVGFALMGGAIQSGRWEISNATQTGGIYLIAAGAVMVVYQIFLWSDRRAALLDKKDAQAEAEAYICSREPSPSPTIKTHRGIAYIPPPPPAGGEAMAWSNPQPPVAVAPAVPAPEIQPKPVAARKPAETPPPPKVEAPVAPVIRPQPVTATVTPSAIETPAAPVIAEAAPAPEIVSTAPAVPPAPAPADPTPTRAPKVATVAVSAPPEAAKPRPAIAAAGVILVAGAAAVVASALHEEKAAVAPQPEATLPEPPAPEATPPETEPAAPEPEEEFTAPVIAPPEEDEAPPPADKPAKKKATPRKKGPRSH